MAGFARAFAATAVALLLQLAVADKINVGVYVGPGASTRAKANVPHVLAYPDSGLDVVTFNVSDLTLNRDGLLNKTSVILFPGGGGTEMANALGNRGLATLRSYIASGKGYVGICAGAYLAISHLHVSAFYDEPRPVHGKDRGDGNVTLALTDAGVETFPAVSPAELNDTLVFYANGPVMQQDAKPVSPLVSGAEALATYTSESVPIERHYHEHSGHGRIAIGINKYAKGTVVISGPHPETNQMDMPKTDGPPSAPDSVRAKLLQSYVKAAAAGVLRE
eukprot:m.115924 g.115924  ORF g.115924 m.115924 type:complete len:278 (-) comp16360_c0_seq1:111-944(-)